MPRHVRHSVELGHAITYERRATYCGKPNCIKPHGPYWYAFWTAEGRTRTCYIGRDFKRVSEKRPDLLKKWKNTNPKARRGKRWC